LAHIWGKRPYTDKNTARDNGFLAFLTYGEGYHNFHHIFETDYRNGIKWWHFDPTKWLIKGCSYLKLTSNLKVSPQNRIEKALADMQMRRTKEKLLNLKNYHEHMDRLQKEYDNLICRLNEYYDAKCELVDLKKQDLKDKYLSRRDELNSRCKQLSQRWQAQKKQWQDFNQQLQFGV
jgi:stearoyl-CoA desaturase (delta-9 desaturase)